MAFLPIERSHALKDRCEPLLLPGLANEHAAAGEIVRNHLVRAFFARRLAGTSDILSSLAFLNARGGLPIE
jgi:hypothetical protein